jgi:hypothetical protein
MNRVLLAVVLLLTTVEGFNAVGQTGEKETVRIFEGSLIEATEKASSEKKALFFIIWENESNSLVQHFVTNILTDPGVIESFENTVITVVDSSGSETGVQLKELFEISNYPLIQLMNVYGEDLYQFESFIAPDQMPDILRRNVLND